MTATINGHDLSKSQAELLRETFEDAYVNALPPAEYKLLRSDVEFILTLLDYDAEEL